ncbi:MAG TPA: 4-hydroxythreonine-4-phosphate dehydrogenase PdxA [Nevskiaceae bacterium]
MRPRPRLWLTTGEPAGIGPEIVLAWAQRFQAEADVILVGDPRLLEARAGRVGYPQPQWPTWSGAGKRESAGLYLRAVQLRAPSVPGHLDVRNAAYVVETLRVALEACLQGAGDAIVTAPVQKSVIADAGMAFTGHTEYFAAGCGGQRPVMMLTADNLRVALATTHLPLRAVPDAITGAGVEEVLRILDRDLRMRFGIARPVIHVCGLNPHAGEGGHMGREEIDVIAPAIAAARAAGINANGPFAADTELTPQRWAQADVVLAMYHDQGLTALKYAGFGHAVNITLGLPVIRTSVDHGTALDLAGTGRASHESLGAAVDAAIDMVRCTRSATMPAQRA